MNNHPWWQHGVIYQIYPRSFSDSNADGIGDLPGIINRLDYLADLGVDALWLSPFYPTPDKDFGYDISDYCNVDPRFGTLADFDTLVSEAHRRGLRIIIDMVMNHTSDQHPWFLESRSSRENPKRDWYIWRDQPNNWAACFGGSTWEYDPHTGQYYLHLFTREQPDVNWRNPQVRQAQLDAFRFWMERGADGFRLDVFNAYFKHPDFPNNPPRLGLRRFDRQKHIFDMDQPEMIPLLQELRALLDSYPERYAVGETYLGTAQKAASYCGPDKLHAAFSFDFTSADTSFLGLPRFPFHPDWIARRIAHRDSVFDAAGVWPTTVMSNHDLPRAASRYSRSEDDSLPKIAMTILLTVRGTPFLYQGEEIAMRDLPLRKEDVQDPAGKPYWPFYKGRDGCRSPMQWDDSPNAGFSSAKPWLRVHPNYRQRNVAAQQAAPASMLNFTKALLVLRKQHPALRTGKFLPILAAGPLLAYLRQDETETILVAMNFSRRTQTLPLPSGLALQQRLLTSAAAPLAISAQTLPLAPYESALWLC